MINLQIWKNSKCDQIKGVDFNLLYNISQCGKYYMVEQAQFNNANEMTQNIAMKVEKK